MTNELILRKLVPASQHPAAVYVASKSVGSRRALENALDTIAGEVGAESAWDVDWAALRFQHTQAIRAKLIEKYAPASVNKMLSALRQTLKTAWRLGQMTAEDYQRAADIENVEITSLPAGRDITPGEVEAIIDKCASDPTWAGRRDVAIIACLHAGLRRAEVVRLDVADFDLATGALHVRGKRQKERLVYIANGAGAAMADWLAIRGDAEGALFYRIRKGDHLTGTRLTVDGVYHILQTRIEQAGVSHLTPHDFRRTFVGELLGRGVDIVTVQHLVGHSDPKTTSRYDRRPEEIKREAMNRLHFPYRR